MRPMHPFHRTELLLGGEGFDRVAASRACVIGLGGVGAHAAEALVRTGIGHVTLVDFDKVCVTNVNRQVHATRKTVGKRKAALMEERCQHINPKCDVRSLVSFYEAETSDEILGEGFDVVLDCIDNMTAKLHLLETCTRRGQHVISAMGAGGRMTHSGCALAISRRHGSILLLGLCARTCAERALKPESAACGRTSLPTLSTRLPRPISAASVRARTRIKSTPATCACRFKERCPGCRQSLE